MFVIFLFLAPQRPLFYYNFCIAANFFYSANAQPRQYLRLLFVSLSRIRVSHKTPAAYTIYLPRFRVHFAFSGLLASLFVFYLVVNSPRQHYITGVLLIKRELRTLNPRYRFLIRTPGYLPYRLQATTPNHTLLY